MGGGSSGIEGGLVATGALDPCGGKIIDAMTGALNVDEYNRQARLWDRATIDCRLGPKFTDLHSGADDGRPTAYEPEHKTASGGYLCPTYELSGTCGGGCDYGSTAGQVLYAPDAWMAPVSSESRTTHMRRESSANRSSRADARRASPDPGLTTWTAKVGRPVRLPNGFRRPNSGKPTPVS